MRRKEISGNRISPIVGRCKATTVLIDLIIPVKIKKPKYAPPGAPIAPQLQIPAFLEKPESLQSSGYNTRATKARCFCIKNSMGAGTC